MAGQPSPTYTYKGASILTDGCSGHADSKEGGAYDRIFPAGTFAAYIYSGDQSVLIIEK